MTKFLDKLRIKIEGLLIDYDITVQQYQISDDMVVFSFSQDYTQYDVAKFLTELNEFVSDHYMYKFYMNSRSDKLIVLYNDLSNWASPLKFLVEFDLNNPYLDDPPVKSDIIFTNELREVLNPNEQIVEDTDKHTDKSIKSISENVIATKLTYDYFKIVNMLSKKFGEVTDSLDIIPHSNDFLCRYCIRDFYYRGDIYTFYLYTEKPYDELSLTEIGNEVNKDNEYNWVLRSSQVVKDGKYCIACSYSKKPEDDNKDSHKYVLGIYSREPNGTVLDLMPDQIKSYDLLDKPIDKGDKITFTTLTPLESIDISKSILFDIMEDEYVIESSRDSAKMIGDNEPFKDAYITIVNDFIHIDKDSNVDELLDFITTTSNGFHNDLNNQVTSFYDGFKLIADASKFISVINAIGCLISDIDLNDIHVELLKDLESFTHKMTNKFDYFQFDIKQNKIIYEIYS